MYVRERSLVKSLSSLAHHFLPVDTKSYKIQPGGSGYELTYGTTAVVPYLKSLAQSGSLDDAFDVIAAHENKLLEVILGYLTSAEARERGVRVVGDERWGKDTSREPTVSFVVTGQRAMKSKDVVAVFDKKGGVRTLFTSNFCTLVVEITNYSDGYPLWPFLCIYTGQELATDARHR